ncbi:MAG: penicillin-binding protein 2 [Armatimonadetes bacterium]|nr:penicillin-binding protein 2 [Armatimonadota bacterium]
MSVIHTPRGTEVNVRLALFPILIGLALVMLFIRLWYFQVVKGPELADAAQVTAETAIERNAPRGAIMDRRGVLLAGVHSENVLLATKAIVEKNPKVLDQAAAMLKIDRKDLEKALKRMAWRPFVPVPIYRNLPIDVATRIAEMGENLPGLTVESQSVRTYPDSASFAHVLGYVGVPGEKDVERLKSMGRKDQPNFVGRSGVERYYDGQLLGTPGKDSLELDAKRRPLRQFIGEAPIPGDQLILSIDADLQKYAIAAMGNRRGGLVAIDPSTGEILAAVSTPGYDTRIFIEGGSQSDFDALYKNEARPLFNRAFSGALAPASTFKIITSLAAAREGKFDPNRYVFCDGGYHIGRQTIKCLSHHGSLSFQSAFTHSCNTYFCDMAMRVGPEAIRKAANECGLGVKPELDALGVSRGLFPTEETIRKAHGRGWYPGDTANSGIGQGDVTATPLQMAGLVATVANDGIRYKPRLLHAFRKGGPAGEAVYLKPEIAARVDAPPGFWSMMRSAMVNVIQSGTARTAQIQGYTWGGKTGSAEKLGQEKTNSWFVGIAPIQNSTIAIAIVVEDAGHGGDVAAPIAASVVAHYLRRSESALSTASSKRATSAARP